jgi:hypothetical protein
MEMIEVVKNMRITGKIDYVVFYLARIAFKKRLLFERELA